MDPGDAADVPPIPTRAHQSYHQHSKSQHINPHRNQHATDLHSTLLSTRQSAGPYAEANRRSVGAAIGKRHNIPPASPEVISNLITSLSAISKPANNHFESHVGAHSLSLPANPGRGQGPGLSSTSAFPTTGSFGVDYGAYSQPGQDGLRDQVSLDELAASSPVIRTSKPTSGYSPLASAQSPQSGRSPSRDSGGLRSFIRSGSAYSSRPSSKGSLASKNDDAHSIGNLSIERRSMTPELKSPRSHDSWSKKSRRDKGLMYMSSRERLRERDFERKRSSFSNVGSNGGGGAANGTTLNGTDQGGAAAAAASIHSGSKGDQFLAETAISEEPAPPNGDPAKLERSRDSPRPIPARESSLRQGSTHGGKRNSGRKPKRHGDGSPGEAIPEADEPGGKRGSERRSQGLPDADLTYLGKSFLFGAEEFAGASHDSATASKQVHESSLAEQHGVPRDADQVDEDGAPFPAVSQGRRRYGPNKERSAKRLSGRQSPGPNEAVDTKRSSSRLKRLSASRATGTSDAEGELAQHRSPNAAPPVGFERPDSADSIDDAVDSYLCSPRLSQKIRHPQTGRVISFSEVGDADGSAVFCCVGMGLTRYITSFYDELALTLKLRLITPDRPGVGDSEPYSDGTATPLSWPDDIYAICQALKITKFSILAHSAGAIYALATALRMPQHIRGRIHLLAPWIPPSQMSSFGASQTMPPTNAIPTSQRILRALPTPILKAANSSFMSATSSSITSSLPKTPRRGKKKSTQHIREAANSQQKQDTAPSQDKENMAQSDGLSKSGGVGVEQDGGGGGGNGDGGLGSASRRKTRAHPDAPVLAAAVAAVADKERQLTYDARLTHAIWDLATTNANPAVDLLVCLERHHTIGFRYMDITRPVVIHHGSRDTRVPVENVKWLGKTMRRCEIRVLEGEGHGLMASAAVMGAVLMEISKEWEDWIRVTSHEGRKERERGRRGMLGR